MSLKEILSQPEGRRLEFKEQLPKTSDLAKTIVAFANDAGGELFIGVRDNPRELVGLPEEELSTIEEQISNIIIIYVILQLCPTLLFSQRVIDLTPSDLRFGETTTVRLCGKGNKVRIVPLSGNQVKNLKQFMTEKGLFAPHKNGYPLFCNPQGNKLTRMAVLNIVKKYTAMSRKKNPILIPEDIGCHSLRHSKAMHMLEADINLVYIRDFLGHSSITTTEIYARTSEKKKQVALDKLNPGIIKNGKSCWQKDKELMGYLKSLQHKF